jgi:NADH dehydrogenase
LKKISAMNIPESNLPRVVVLGAGFAGLNFVKNLPAHAAQIVMIDRHNYHTFQPLLYQVATAGLEPDSIAYPIRNIFKKRKNFFFRMAAVNQVDSQNKCIHSNIGTLSYDILVVATGSQTNFFGIPGVKELALPMKTVPEALNMRSLMLQNFEAASLTKDLEERERLMNFVIVGAGPTGTELAGALAELRNHVLPNDYPDLDFRRMSIHLIEMHDAVLPPMQPSSSKHALKYLESLGVQVWLKTAVTSYDGDTVFTSQNKQLPASTLIWAAGVQGNIPKGFKEEQIWKGRLVVDETNQVKGAKEVYGLGDVAVMRTEDLPNGHPMLAQVAIQQGKLLAKNLKAYWKGREMKPFKYKDLGAMATVGRNKAVAELSHKIKLSGFVGWFVWMWVHLVSLVGFRNRLVVLLNWVVNYFSYDRKIRLIIRPVDRPAKHKS